jgi:hypothetical protein
MSGDTRTGSIPVCGIGQKPQEYRIYGIPEVFFRFKTCTASKKSAKLSWFAGSARRPEAGGHTLPNA